MRRVPRGPLGALLVLLFLLTLTVPRMAPVLAEGGGGSDGAATTCWPSSCGGCAIGGCNPSPKPYCYYVHCSECTCVCYWGNTRVTVTMTPCPNVVN